MTLLVISDKHGVLGQVWEQGGLLTGDTPAARRLAREYQDRHGPDAYAQLARLDNGYVRASEQPD